MRHEAMLRQVALVGYGTRFLRDELPLEDWHRHGVFRDARLLFRNADNALLADDFTYWLGTLKEEGAVRLSLHQAAELGVADPPMAEASGYVVVVHYAGHHQPWVIGTERASWCPPVPSPYPDATYYGGAVDTYWCADNRQGTLAVPDTDWKVLAATIAADLKITVPSSRAPDGPFFAPYRDHPAALPLFPSSSTAALAHRVLATLDREQGIFANDTNPKNDSSYYQHLDEKAAAEADAWGRRLDSWMTEVQLRCANESRGASSARWRTDAERNEPARPDVAPPVRESEEVRAAHSASSRWTRRLAFFVVLGVLALLTLGISHLIAAFPWAAVLIALLGTLYVRHDK